MIVMIVENIIKIINHTKIIPGDKVSYVIYMKQSSKSCKYDEV